MNEAQEARLDRLEERLDEQGMRLRQKTTRINELEGVIAAQALILGGTCSMLEEFIDNVDNNHKRVTARINLLKATDDYLLYLTDDLASYVHLKPSEVTVASKEGVAVAFRLAKEADERE